MTKQASQIFQFFSKYKPFDSSGVYSWKTSTLKRFFKFLKKWVEKTNTS